MLKPFTNEGRFECGLDNIVKGKVWAFVAVVGHATPARLGVAIANERGYNPIPETWCHADDYEEMERHADELNEAEGISVKVATDIVASSMVRQFMPFTVIFFVDGDHGVESFVQQVQALRSGDAFELAVEAAQEIGAADSGRTLSDSEWGAATEIITFNGHLESAS
jgi:hypothetical protein